MRDLTVQFLSKRLSVLEMSMYFLYPHAVILLGPRCSLTFLPARIHRSKTAVKYRDVGVPTLSSRKQQLL